jgi:uncharacterized membrane protein
MKHAITIIGLGAVAGVRSFTAPALLAQSLRGRRRRGRPSRRAALLLRGLAMAEMAADKLPDLPARIERPALAGRIASGAIVGGMVGAREGRRATGAALGGAAALVTAFLSYEARRAANRVLPLPDPLIGLVEDALVVGGGRGLLRRARL